MTDMPAPPVPEEPPFEAVFPEHPALVNAKPAPTTKTPPPIPGELAKEAVALGGELTQSPNEPLFTQPFGEAPVSLHTVMFRPSKSGDYHWVSVTIRGEDPMNTLSNFMEAIALTEDAGWIARLPAEGTQVSPLASPPSMVQAPTGAPPNPPQSNAAAAVSPAPNKSDNGTDILHKIIVVPTPKGLKVEFYVGRFMYPMSDSRSSDVIAALFDPSLGWQPQHFDAPQTYDLANYNYLADWVKIVKQGTKGKPATYYNVMHVHKA